MGCPCIRPSVWWTSDALFFSVVFMPSSIKTMLTARFLFLAQFPQSHTAHFARQAHSFLLILPLRRQCFCSAHTYDLLRVRVIDAIIRDIVSLHIPLHVSLHLRC